MIDPLVDKNSISTNFVERTEEKWMKNNLHTESTNIFVYMTCVNFEGILHLVDKISVFFNFADLIID